MFKKFNLRDAAGWHIFPITRVGEMKISQLIKIVFIVGLYTLTARFGLKLDAVSGFATLIWAPAGIALAALVLFGINFWPAVFVGAFLANYFNDASILLAFIIGIGNTGGAVVAAYMLKDIFGFERSLTRLKDVVWFGLAGIGIGPAVSASIGTTAVWKASLQTFETYSGTWEAWWLGDALGVLLVSPLLFVWSQKLNRHCFQKFLEVAFFLISFLYFAGIVFEKIVNPLRFPLHPYVLIPFAVWAAIRFGQKGSTLVTLVIALMSIFSVVQGGGPFYVAGLRESLVLVHSFISVVALMGITLAAATAERDQLFESQIESNRKLSETKNQLDTILRSITDGISVIDSEENILFANDLSARVRGYPSARRIIHRKLADTEKNYELFDAKMQPIPWEKAPYRLALQGQTTPDREICFRNKQTGEERWSLFKSVPVFDDSGDVKLAVNIFKDFTKHKRSEENLKFLDEANQVLGSSLDYKETLENIAKLTVPRFADWCAVDIKEVDHPQRIAVAHKDPEKLEWAKEFSRKFPPRWDAKTGAGNVLRTGKSEIYPNITEEMLISSGRSEAYLEYIRQLGMTSVILVPLKSRNQTFGVITMISAESGRHYDEYDLKCAEELAQRASIAVDNAILYKHAQEAIRLRDEFLSIASHELKTPLTSLSLQIQLADRGLKRERELLESADRLVRVFDSSNKQVRRLTTLVDELLDVSRIQAGRFTFDFVMINLSNLVKDVVQRMSDQLIKAGCSVNLAIEDGIWGEFDSLRIEQILNNLLSNAIKYACGTSINIELKRVDAKVQLVVEDHGPGIPVEQQASIFDRFVRAKNAANIAGMGLGLFIVREIVRGHAGTIKLDSDRGRGAKFTIDLPLQAKRRAAETEYIQRSS